MNAFENEEEKKRELEELKRTREELSRMPAAGMKEEIEHLLATLDLAQQAAQHNWLQLFKAHRVTIAAGMDLLFERLASGD